MDSDACWYTIPRLARRIGVTPAAIRQWIAKEYIEPPEQIPATGERVYRADAVASVERWYMRRAAAGETRGPDASRRREVARVWLTAHGLERSGRE